jgi:hypothetical protein
MHEILFQSRVEGLLTSEINSANQQLFAVDDIIKPPLIELWPSWSAKISNMNVQSWKLYYVLGKKKKHKHVGLLDYEED